MILFNKIEKKTNINKETILSLASKLQNNNMKDRKDEIRFLTSFDIRNPRQIRMQIT